MARGDWIRSAGRWCHRDDVEPSARELRKGEDRRQVVPGYPHSEGYGGGNTPNAAPRDSKAIEGPPLDRPVTSKSRGRGASLTGDSSVAALLSGDVARAVADAMEGLRLNSAGRQRAQLWIGCFRSGDWSHLPPWLSVADTELIYRAAQAARDNTPPGIPCRRLSRLMAAFAPYRFDDDLVTDDLLSC